MSDSGNVFHRTVEPLVAVGASGCWIVDENDNRYLDAAGGAIVCGIGHGRSEIAAAIANQIAVVDYAHAGTFTTAAAERYATRVAAHLPMDDARVFPVSGGSEATETAIKMVVAFHATRGEPHRTRIVSLDVSYHGNTLGALDLSGRPSLRAPYESLLGRFDRIPATHVSDDPAWHVEQLERMLESRADIGAFLAEPIGGAASGGAVPPDGYWAAMSDVCREHGVLVVADEVMTGFGRTGTWFASEHFGLRPDMLTAGKGASSGYWPLGLCVVAPHIAETIGPGRLIHGFTFSHHPMGAAVGNAVLDILENEHLVERGRNVGERLREGLTTAGFTSLTGHGPLVGVDTGLPNGEVVTAARRRGLLVYPSTDTTVLLGPPLVISDDEIDQVVGRLSAAVADLT